MMLWLAGFLLGLAVAVGVRAWFDDREMRRRDWPATRDALADINRRVTS